LRIESRAPTRIDLAGGTLDIWPLYLFHPGALTVNCAVTRHASCFLESAPGGSRAIQLISLDSGKREKFASLAALEKAKSYKLPLLAELVKIFQPQAGFSLTTSSEAPAGAGLGGSSAMAVAICGALDKFTGRGLPREKWIHISRDAEAIVIKVPTGTQDHYPPAFGGPMAIHLEAGGERRENCNCDLEVMDRRLVLCYTGKPRQSGINNWEVYKDHIDGGKRVQKNLEEIAAIARAVREALLRNNWNEIGRLVNEEWAFRRRNLPTISTPMIDRIIKGACRAGALAGKVCGAGGGGCVALVIETDARARVEAVIEKVGATLLPMKVAREGVSVKVS
jgi:D-glycero-alpha-D-manno-heptose-7-phosphate kinase